MVNITLTERQENDNNHSIWSDIGLFFGAYYSSLLVVLLMVAGCIGWGYLCSFSMPWPDPGEYPSWNVGFGISYEPFYKGDNGHNFWGDIWMNDYNFLGDLFRIETLFYFFPFLAGSLSMCFATSKRGKWIIGLLSGCFIFCLQLQLGYLCYERWYNQYYEVWNDVGSVTEHILLFGGFGVFFAITYGLVLYNSYNDLLNSKSKKDKLKAVLLAHLLAVLASSTVILIVWTTWFGVILFVVYLMAVSVIWFIGYAVVSGVLAIKKLHKRKQLNALKTKDNINEI